MNLKEWQVIWYDADGHEIDQRDFLHQNDARRMMSRVCEERVGRSVELRRMRRTAEAAARGLAYDGWDPVEQRDCE